jgi:hypothetical protein
VVAVALIRFPPAVTSVLPAEKNCTIVLGRWQPDGCAILIRHTKKCQYLCDTPDILIMTLAYDYKA